MDSPDKKVDDFRGLRSCTINPLDLVTAVFICANTFLQQEITAHMLQCQFAVPLLLPHVADEEPSCFLLWPFRDVVRQWQTQYLDHNQKVQEAVFTSTFMPMISCVRLGSCSVSKSQVLNHIIGSDTFIHKGMEGGQLPRSLSNGLVETAWALPAGDPNNFSVPVVFSNLRGDASTHEKCLYLLSQASSAIIVFCENPTEKEKELLATCKDMTTKLIVIDLSEIETREDRVVKFVGKTLQDQICLPDGSVVSGSCLNAENVATVLCDTLKHLLPDLRLVTLEGAAKLAVELGIDCDEGTVCKKSMGIAEEVLKGLDEGPAVFRQKQLPLQGALWSRLAEIEKEESRKNKEGKELDPRLQNEKKDILGNLSRYKMTPSMKSFTKAVSTTDKVERMYFLSWMRVKLRLQQMHKQIGLKDLMINQQTKENNGIPECIQSELQNGANDARDNSDSFCTDSTFEDGEIEQLTANDQELADSRIEVVLKPIFQTQSNKGSESLLSGHFHSNEKENRGEEILQNNGSLNPVLRENGTIDVHGGSTAHHTSAEEETCQDSFVKGQTATSVHSCLLRLKRRNGNNLEVVDSESYLSLKHSFQTENAEGIDGHFLPPNDQEILAEEIREKYVSLNSVPIVNGTSDVHRTDYSESTVQETSTEEQTWQDASVDSQTVTSTQSFLLRLKQHFDNNLELADSEREDLKHSFQTQNNKDSEALQNGQFDSNKNKFPGEEILKNVSLDAVLREKAVLSVHGNDCSESTFHKNSTEEQKCQGTSVESQAVTSAQSLLLELERFTDDLKFVDLESYVGLNHNCQTTSNEESESLQNGHFDSSNEKEIPGEEILEKVSLNPVFRNNGILDVHGTDLFESNFQETYAEEQMGQAVSIKDRAATSAQSFLLGLEHFLREMGLIFELTHIRPGNESHNVLRLPTVAADLILSGIPLELMDGDSTNIPIRWLGSVLAEINHRFPQNRFRTLTSLGVHQARNAEILSALFGVKFPDECKRSTRGLYIDALQLPSKLKTKLNCDFLLLIDVDGLCSTPSDSQISTQISDNEMATVATGMSDVLLQNLYSRAASEFEASLTVGVNALLRIREYGSIPICKVLVQDEGINTILEATQLKRVSNMLQTKTGERTLRDADTMTPNSKKKSSIMYVRPWYREPLSKSVDTQHSEAMLKLKRTLFEALKEAAAQSETSGLPDFMGRLCSVWEAVKAESFSISLQNKDIALALSIFCTELSQQEDSLLEHMECWLMQATKTIYLTKPESLDPSSQNDFLCELKFEARREVKREVNKQRSNVKACLKENKLDVHIKILKTIILSNMTELEERVTETVLERLETINENHCSSTQLNRIETILQIKQDARLEALLGNSESNKQLFKDKELEEEFEGIWKEALSNFDFRPSDTEDITTRVKNILSANLINHGLQKHLNKLLNLGQNQTTCFRVDDQYFGYSSRMKNLFENNNNKSPKAKAQQLASNIMERYQQFVEDKVSLPQDFSDSYITELLEMIDKSLKETQLDTRRAFEMDLKVFVCNAACRDFQRVHNRFAKDGELLKSIKAKKRTLMTEFIYQFRKTDQRQRLAQRFISDIIQPTVTDYVYKPLGMQIADDIKSKAPQYLSPQAFHKSLLEELIKEDTFEGFTEYLLSYDSFRLRKIQETVVAHLSDWNVNTWRHERLGDIIGKVAAAASQVTEGTSAALSDTKPMLEQVCLILEDGDVCIPWESLKGPLYSITTEWDRFITCFMELLAALRLDLAQAFSQHIGSDQLLECLPTQPSDCLFNKVKGCDARCPVCSAPCEVEQTWHRVHEASLHRPKCMLEPTSLISHECANPDDLDPQDVAVACWEFQPLHLGWNLSPEETSSQTPSPYWRYVLARFNERFAKKYNQKPTVIPEEWKAMTQQEALDSLRETFFHCGEL
ncbi:interferon-induced very large GTPase 1 [Phyllopteryx taeniolatus]|uniref:interferon-induced very large GTPase 1 n=1 Tax=Phyllopteryx taeniolatus TaxID=161469 RepID=UPI002AD5596E|nr:interferon-induced very large GTPase 1 [Phyllopteryx taeniolatus]